MLLLDPSVFSKRFQFLNLKNIRMNNKKKMITRKKQIHKKYEQERIAIPLQRQVFQLFFEEFWDPCKILQFVK